MFALTSIDDFPQQPATDDFPQQPATFRRVLLNQTLLDQIRQLSSHERGELFDAGVTDSVDASEVSQQALLPFVADYRDPIQFGSEVSDPSPLAMIGDGKTMGFISDFLGEVKHGGGLV